MQGTIENVIEVGRCLILFVKTNAGRERTLTVVDHTIKPYAGDTFYFPQIAVPDATGKSVGGGGMIEMDDNAFPYQRVSYSQLVQGWD